MSTGISGKTTEEQTSEEKVGMLCRIHLKVEAGIYAALGYLISLPVLAALGIVKAAVWVVAPLYPVLLAIISLIIPLLELAARALSYAFRAVIGFLRWCIRKAIAFFRWINWCVVRSIIRMFAIVAGIGSFAITIKGHLQYPVGTVITGQFYDPNPEIVFIHSMIVISLLSVLLYYSAWAWSKPEETDVVCIYTKRLAPSFEMFKKIWNK